MYETTLRSYNHQNYFYSIFLIFNLVNVIYVRIDLLEYIYIYIYIYIYMYIYIYIYNKYTTTSRTLHQIFDFVE